MPKISKSDLNGLSRFFRKKLRDPAIHNLIGGKREAVKYIEEDLPTQLLDMVEKLETQHQMPSWLKMSRLVEKSYYWLKHKNLLWLKPFIGQFLEYGVQYIYKEHFIERMTKVGLHDEIEEFFRLDLDGSGEIGDEQVDRILYDAADTHKDSGQIKEPEEVTYINETKNPPENEAPTEKVWPPLKDEKPETETED